jgi:hypothetical protein
MRKKKSGDSNMIQTVNHGAKSFLHQALRSKVKGSKLEVQNQRHSLRRTVHFHIRQQN